MRVVESVTADPRVNALVERGRMERARSARRHRPEIGPLRTIDDAGAPLWPAVSGSEYLEHLSCGHYRKCVPKCKARSHRCDACAEEGRA